MKEVFLCCEFSFEHERALDGVARTVCDALRAKGYEVFFTVGSSPDAGVDGYLWMVSSHLDRAKALVLVSERPSDCASGWAQYEWESFYRDISLRRMHKFFATYLKSGREGYPRGILESPSFVWGDIDGLLAALDAFFSAEGA